MKLERIRAIGKEMGINPLRMKKAELVRAIQQVEGNDDCFEIGDPKTCGQLDCLWREDCLKSLKGE